MVTMKANYPKVILLMLLTIGFVFGCVSSGFAAEAVSPDQIAAVQEIITAWDAKYSTAEIAPHQWNQEEAIQAFYAADLETSFSELVPKLDALQTAMLTIITDDAYADISPEHLTTFVPYIGFYINEGVPTWHFNLFPPDEMKDPNGFTIFINAETGELVSLVYAPGNG